MSEDGVSSTAMDELAAGLRAAGYHAFVNACDDSFVAISGALGHVECHEYYPPRWLPDQQRYTSGRSFWVHRAGGMLVLGTWAPREYLATRCDCAARLVAEMFTAPNTALPPAWLVERFGLRAITLLDAYFAAGEEASATAGSVPHDGRFTQDAFLARAGRSFDECRLTEDGRVHLRVGCAEAFTRFLLGAHVPHPRLTVVVYGNLADSEDHYRLGMRLRRAFRTPLYLGKRELCMRCVRTERRTRE